MRTLTGVSVETVRHWRKNVPYLASKTGKAARFSFSDLLGLAVTNELVGSLGVHIGTISPGIDALFVLLADASIPVLDGSIAFITPTSASLHELGAWGSESVPTEPTFTIPLNPLIARLQLHMLPVTPAPSQAALPFPPEAVRSRA